MNILITELSCFAFIVQKRDKDLQNRNSINKIKETPSFENKNYVMTENKLKKYLANFIETQLKYLAILFKKHGIKCWNSNEIKNLNQEKVKKLNNVKLMSFY